VSAGLVLALDAATYRGTAALLRDGAVVAGEEVAMRGEQEERLLPAVAALLAGTGVHVAALTAVACGAGPGSFTSLRIAAAIAKGIASARRLPLHVVSSLALTVAAAELPAGEYLSVLDAMRGDVFAQRVRRGADGRVKLAGEPGLVPRSELAALAEGVGARVVGPGEAIDAAPHARGFARLWAEAAPADLATWEPAYGRLAEAQTKWERAHGRPLGAA
jgi:tRNA threonylcarbamoyl adenosine modification protein YeaZ